MSSIFIHFDPTLATFTIDLSQYGFQSGDIVEITVVGAFVASTSNPQYDTDTFVNLALAYNGITEPGGAILEDYNAPHFFADNQNGAYLLNSGFQLTIINCDYPINDNADPNRDYGIQITKISLFTPGVTTDFNNLSPEQVLAAAALIQANDPSNNIYNGLGGNQTVILPNEQNYNEYLTGFAGGQAPIFNLGWTDSSASTFYTNSQQSDTYNVTGGNGSYYIVEGAGTETIKINGNGSSNITAGSGTDTISITGNGDNAIKAGTGTASITIDGSGDNTVNGNVTGSVSISGGGTLQINGSFNGSATISAGSTLELDGPSSGGTITFDPSGTNETLQIDGTTMPTNVINGFAEGDQIDLAGVIFTNLSGATASQSPDLFQLNANEATDNLSLAASQPSDFAFIADPGGGTILTENSTNIGTDDAKLVLSCTRAFLGSIAALQGNLEGFDELFVPFFRQLGNAAAAYPIIQQYQTDYSAANGDVVQEQAAAAKAIAPALVGAVKIGLSTVITKAVQSYAETLATQNSLLLYCPRRQY